MSRKKKRSTPRRARHPAASPNPRPAQAPAYTLLEIGSRAAAALGIFVVFYRLWLNRHLPALGTDSLIYHLTLPARWLQQGYLAAVDLPFHDSAAEHSPMLFQTLVYLLMRITGDDGLTWLVQPAFYLLMYWLFYQSVRLFGSGRRLAMTLTGILVFHLPFLNNLDFANNDVVLTCGCALFLYGLLLMQVRFERGALLAGGGLALMLATKVIGVVYAAAGLPALGFVMIFQQKRLRRAVRWRRLLVPLFGLLLLGSAFTLRNVARYGNPLYPAAVSPFGVPLFEGLYDASVLVDHGWSPQALARMLVNDDRPDEFFALRAPISHSLWITFWVSALLLAVGPLSRKTFPRLAACLLFPLAAIALFFAVTPFWREHRLLFPVHYVLWLCFAHAIAMAAQLHAPRSRLLVEIAMLSVFAGLVAMAGPALFEGCPLWVLGLVIAAAAGTTLLAKRHARRPRLLVGALGILAVLAASCGPWWYPAYRANRLLRRSEMYAEHYGAKGRAWNLVDALSGQDGGKVIAYAGSPIIFPLFGSRLENRVDYVPLSPGDVPRPVDLQRGDSVYLRLANARRDRVEEDRWLAEIERRRVDLLYLADDPDRGGIAEELAIVAKHPDRFRPVFDAPGVYVFECAGSLASRSSD